MIIDIHTHTFPDELAARAVAALSARAKIQPHADGTCAGLCASMRRAGIDYAVTMPVATKPSQVRAINAAAVEISRQYPTLINFGALHPAQDDWAEEVERLAGDGIPGVKFHPDYQDFFVDEERMLPLYRALAAHGLIVLFHAGVDIGLPPPVHCPPDRLARVLDAVPELPIIAAHMGGYYCWEAVEQYLLGRDVYLDTSYSLADLGAERMARLIRTHGAQRILFGTDSPWTGQAAEIAGIRHLGLTIEEQQAILGENAARLLKLPSGTDTEAKGKLENARPG
jgi:predicted TIM-barrel fold metal-dependent hydrolase